MRTVAKTSRQVAADPNDGDWAELGRGRWAEARAIFEEALAREETPEACEGLSWAAWWLDDAEAVFRARECAYRLYKKSGDTASAARMATWLASDHLDFYGSAAVSSGWLRRAHRLLEPLDPGPDHGWLAFHEGYLAHAAGDTAGARERAAVAAELGRRFAVPDLEMLGLALEGATLVACAQVQEGMRCLDEATAAALEGEATIPISGAWACCFLVGACTAVLDYERASEWCDRIAEFAERYGSRYMLAFCRAESARFTSGEASGQRPRRCSSCRSRSSRARVLRGRQPRSSRWPSSGGARAGRRRPPYSSTEPAPPRRSSCAAPASRSTEASRFAQPSSSSGSSAKCLHTENWSTLPSSRCSSRPESLAGSSPRQTRRSTGCRRSSGWSARHPCAHSWNEPKDGSLPQAATTSRLGRRSRTPSTASRGAAHPTKRP